MIGATLRKHNGARVWRWRRRCALGRLRTTLLGALLSVGLVAPVEGQSRGSLYIVGGGPQPEALVREFVSLAGGPGKARIVVFAMASESGRTSGEEKAQDFRALGAQARNLYLSRDEAMRDSIAALLDSATGIWFGGGDQVLLTNALRGTVTEQRIHARYAAGAVIGGTSAGAAVMSRVMITGDERRPGGARPDTTLAWGTIERDNVVVTDGFGLLPDVIVDQHFLRRKRYGRLLALVLERAPHLGAGIDESTALVIDPDGRWRVRGASSVVIFDARRAERPNAGRLVQGAQVLTYVLSDGATFDPATGRVSFGTGK